MNVCNVCKSMICDIPTNLAANHGPVCSSHKYDVESVNILVLIWEQVFSETSRVAAVKPLKLFLEILDILINGTWTDVILRTFNRFIELWFNNDYFNMSEHAKLKCSFDVKQPHFWSTINQKKIEIAVFLVVKLNIFRILGFCIFCMLALR